MPKSPLNVLIVGYGAMGRAVERQLTARGHHVVERVGRQPTAAGVLTDIVASSTCDVAIEFSVPAAAKDNVTVLLQHRIPVVSGTTGWEPQTLTDMALELQTPFLHAANFSIGIAVLKRAAEIATERLCGFSEFEPAIFERHHNRKLDSPSGTAKLLQSAVQGAGYPDNVPVTSLRQGNVPESTRCSSKVEPNRSSLLTEPTRDTSSRSAPSALPNGSPASGRMDL